MTKTICIPTTDPIAAAHGAIRKAIKGAKAVSATVVTPASRNMYDQHVAPVIEVTWDNGIVTRHHDLYCGEDGIEGGMPRPHITAVGVVAAWQERHGWDTHWMPGDSDATVRLDMLSPTELRRIEAAVALAE